MEAGNAVRDQVTVTLPFRILPSTRPRPLRIVVLLVFLALFGAGLVINIGVAVGDLPPKGQWGIVTWRMTSNGRPSADLVWLWICLFAVASWVTLYNLTCETAYLRPSSRYWIEVSSDGMSLISPLGTRRYRWPELPLFSVRTLRMRGWRVVRVIAWVSRVRWVVIRSDDFATELSGSRREAAQILADTLNDLRNRLAGRPVATVMLPAGLRIVAVVGGPTTRSLATHTVVRQG